jgi:hypothetical protein
VALNVLADFARPVEATFCLACVQDLRVEYLKDKDGPLFLNMLGCFPSLLVLGSTIAKGCTYGAYRPSSLLCIHFTCTAPHLPQASTLPRAKWMTGSRGLASGHSLSPDVQLNASALLWNAASAGNERSAWASILILSPACRHRFAIQAQDSVTCLSNATCAIIPPVNLRCSFHLVVCDVLAAATRIMNILRRGSQQHPPCESGDSGRQLRQHKRGFKC